MRETTRGHLAALFTIVIWALTFISIKVLLRSFSPMEVTFIRLLIAYGSLALFSLFTMRKNAAGKRPKQPVSRFSKQGLAEERFFMLAGFLGVTAYFLLQNIGMNYTTATNTSIILNTVPIFTALLAWLFLRDRTAKHPLFLLGFALAMSGIVLISQDGSAAAVHLRGDLLILLAAIVWGCYTLVSPRLNTSGLSAIQVTRRVYFWGLVWMIPVMILVRFRPPLARMLQPQNLLHFLFLGVLASGVCFVTWNYAIRKLGSVKASIYIYGQPIIAVLASSLVLQEKMTGRILLGMILSFLGVILSGLPGRRQ